MISRRRTWQLAALVVAGYLVVQLAGLKSVGLTDDDDFYVPAGISYARWLGDAMTFDGAAWSRAGIDAAFTPNKEHPPLAKYVFGVSHFVFRGLLGPTDSARVGTVLFSTLSAALLMFLAISHLGGPSGLRVGGLAVLMLLTLPRFYFHSHAATLDVPVATMYLAAAAVALRAERSALAGLIAGPVFGLATATKLNAPFLLLAYLPFVLLVRQRQTTEQAGPLGLSLPTLPVSLLSMATLGPLTFFAVWPWMWFDVVARVTEYVTFHVNHYGIYFLYFGRVFTSDPYGPWHAPFVMAASTVPLATSAFAVIGALAGAPVIIGRLRSRAGPDDAARREGDLTLFCCLNLVTTISVVAFAGTPIYGGAKLFMPFFPFLCLLAGYGANVLYERLAGELGRALPAALVVGLAAMSGAAQQIKFGGYALSQYNGLVGGLRGATAYGFERQYYDVAFRDLVRWLSDNAPPNARVHFLPNNWEYVRTYKWYRLAGELRSDIQVVQGEASADWVVITHERRFARYAADLRRYRGKPVLEEKIIDGTPIWTVVQGR